MESNESWQTASPMGGTDEATFQFNYTNQLPAGGEGGCLAIYGLGQTRCLAWQEITITPGHSYVFDGVFKNASADVVTNTWMEIILSKNAPDPENDYHPGDGDYIYANNTWMSAPWGDFSSLNGKFLDVAQFKWIKGSSAGTDTILTTDTIHIPDTVTVTTWYVGIKAGIWYDSPGTGNEFTYLFDNMRLWDLAEPLPTGFQNTKNDMISDFNVFPNPSRGIVNLKSDFTKFTQYSVFNSHGALVEKGNITGDETKLDLNALSKGVYYITISTPLKTHTQKLILIE